MTPLPKWLELWMKLTAGAPMLPGNDQRDSKR